MRHNNCVTRKLCTYSYTNASITDMQRSMHMQAAIFVYVYIPEAVRLVRQTQLKHVCV